MSQWTHVNASIRFDGVFGRGQPTEEDLGRICRWEDEDTSHWVDNKLPCGSEGSMEYKIVKTGGDNTIASMVVVFVGDLRDYNDDEAIIKYFNDLVSDFMVRSGIIDIDVEGESNIILRYDYKKEEFVKVYVVEYSTESF